MAARRENPLAFDGNLNIILCPQTCSKGAAPTAVAVSLKLLHI
jgi:hypothetical protein